MATREENIKTIQEDLEKLTDEQLEAVAGGGILDHSGDSNFFMALGIEAGFTGRGPTLTSTFAKYGVKYSDHLFASNEYEIDGKNYSRASALCYVLKQMNYKDFNGDWQNKQASTEFLKKYFGGKVMS